MPDPKTWGIDTGYVDARQEWKEAPPETIEAILDAMGAGDDGRPPESPDRKSVV
jgi:hypothetical protein